MLTWGENIKIMKKISVSLSGHQTSIALEPEFIDALHELAQNKKMSVAQIIGMIDNKRDEKSNLTSAIRVWILAQYRK